MAFSWYRTVTIDHTKVPSNQTDFPVLISGTYSYLAVTGSGGLVTNSNGYDIGFYADAGLTTKLKWETERYISTTGEVIYWVKVPSVSSSVDTVIYIAYTDPTITTDQSDPTNVWDSNFLGVYHMRDGSTLSGADSTSNARNGTLTNTPTAATGKIDGAGSFASASTQYIALGTGIHPTAITMSAWVNATSFPNFFNGIIERNNAVADFAVIRVRTNGKMAMVIAASGGNKSYDNTGSAMSAGTWYHVVLTYDSSSGLIGYLNASVDGTDTAGGTLNSSAGVSTDIATDPTSTSTQAWDGLLDEVRVSSIARSADWITAEYNNQLTPSTFYALGTQTAFIASAGNFSGAAEAAASFTPSTINTHFTGAAQAAAAFATLGTAHFTGAASASASFTSDLLVDLSFTADSEASATVLTESGTAAHFSAPSSGTAAFYASFTVPQITPGIIVTITDPGSGYTTPPGVTFSGVTGATGIAILDGSGHVIAVQVTCKGTDPTGGPGGTTVTIDPPSPGPGTPATAVVGISNPTSSSNSRLIPFLVRNDGYGNVCIETNFTNLTPNAGFGSLLPPPFPQPLLETAGFNMDSTVDNSNPGDVALQDTIRRDFDIPTDPPQRYTITSKPEIPELPLPGGLPEDWLL